MYTFIHINAYTYVFIYINTYKYEYIYLYIGVSGTYFDIANHSYMIRRCKRSTREERNGRERGEKKENITNTEAKN